MKSFILAALAIFTVGFYSCGPQPVYYQQQPTVVTTQAQADPYYNADYQVNQNGGTQMVVVRDNDGTQFLMDYLLFNSLYGQGYGNVVNYYHSHHNIYRPYNSGYYSSWRRVRTSSFGRQSYSNTYLRSRSTPAVNPSSGFRSQRVYQTQSNPNSAFRSRGTSTPSPMTRTSINAAPRASSMRSSGFRRR